jgi:hypothetical protein
MNNQNTNAAAGNKDYLDKALDAAEKKFGGSAGSVSFLPLSSPLAP